MLRLLDGVNRDWGKIALDDQNFSSGLIPKMLSGNSNEAIIINESIKTGENNMILMRKKFAKSAFFWSKNLGARTHLQRPDTRVSGLSSRTQIHKAK